MKIKYKSQELSKKKKRKTKKKASSKEIKEQREIEKMYQLKPDYADTIPLMYKSRLIPFDEVTYGIIESSDVKEIALWDGHVEIEQSWVGVILLVLDAIREDAESRGEKFEDSIIKSELTSNHINIGATYGKYRMGSGRVYKAFKLYDSNIYVEILMEPYAILDILAKLFKYIKTPYKNVIFNVERKEAPKIKLSVSNEDLSFIETNVEGCEKYLSGGYVVSGIKIDGVEDEEEYIDVNNIDTSVVVLSNILYVNFGVEAMGKLASKYPEHFCTSDSKHSHAISDSGFYVMLHTQGKDAIKEFMDLIKAVELTLEVHIKLRFNNRKSKEKLKEWEVE